MMMNLLQKLLVNSSHMFKRDSQCYFKRIRKYPPVLFMSSRPSYAGQESTVFALATGGIPSAVAIVRVSGKTASKVLELVGRFPAGQLPTPRKATVKKLYDVTKGSIIDQALILWFPGPNSYTGEDCCEFHVHGGPSVVKGLLGTISTIKDCRMAEAGEFTRRAFLNGKMDLTEVDGLGDLMAAETEMQRIQALNQMDGALGKIYYSWRDTIAKCLADVEAFIDFGDEENIEFDTMKRVETRLELLLEEIRRHLEDSRRGERLRDGVTVAILGKPNAGKSSLLNLLCKREAAIVSEIPGTTRDVVQATINISGYPVVLADTAGIRSDSSDVIEVEGIRRAMDEAKRADIIILLLDLTRSEPRIKATSGTGNIDKKKLISQTILFSQDSLSNKNKKDVPLEKILLVGNKVDLGRSYNELDAAISCKTQEGYEDFTKLLTDRVSKLCANPKSQSPCLTRQRYRSHLEHCLAHLEEYVSWSKQVNNPSNNSNINPSIVIDFALGTVPLKSAINCIGWITGHVGTEEILDIIFRDFCIGK